MSPRIMSLRRRSRQRSGVSKSPCQIPRPAARAADSASAWDVPWRAVGDGPAAPHHFAVDVQVTRAALGDEAPVTVRLTDVAIQRFAFHEAAQVVARGAPAGEWLAVLARAVLVAIPARRCREAGIPARPCAASRHQWR
jgi:hypothetical protein